MDVEWVGEHDKDDDGCAADRRRHGVRVHADDVALDVAPVGEITGDGDEKVDCGCRSDACDYDACGSEMGVVSDFV